MTGAHRALVCGAIASIALSAISVAWAHDNAPGVLALESLGDGRYHVAFTRPTDTREPASEQVAPRFPSQCTLEGSMLDCGAEDLTGRIGFEALEGTRMRVVVVLTRDGASLREYAASGEQPDVVISAPPAGLVAWIAIGLEHVLGGLDHLAFVLGLLLVSTLDRRLLLTITAFTLAHSVTLAMAVLGWLTLPSLPVEACIALSVVLVAREGLRPESDGSLTRRAPWVVAAIFGLVHGLGFAGALRDLGLPEGSLGVVLLGFNLGVEVGQLLVVAAAWMLASIAMRVTPRADRARPLFGYVLGALGAFWLIERTASILLHP